MYHCVDLFIFYSAELCNRALEVRERAPFLNGLFFFVIYVFNTHLFSIFKSITEEGHNDVSTVLRSLSSSCMNLLSI